MNHLSIIVFPQLAEQDMDTFDKLLGQQEVRTDSHYQWANPYLRALYTIEY